MLRRRITMSTPSRSSLGKYGEDFACRYLQNMGYKLLARNFRCHRYGEIDLIVEKSGCISFIEVKTRASTRFGRPIEAVTPAKQRKIHRCAEYYLQCRGLLDDLGDFSISINSIGAESAADYNPAIHVRKLNVNWSAGTRFQNLQEEAVFNLVATRKAARLVVKALKAGKTSVDLTGEAKEPENGGQA